MKNAELIVRMLEQAGVGWVFGIPSGPVLPLIEALRQRGLPFVLTASESSAGFMASTVGALTGIPGVCAATLGPGATNLTTGVGAAWLDRAPALAITCNVSSEWLERRIQMRIDHHALFGPLTKDSFALRSNRVAGPLAVALALASAEPPGPVHLDLPEDVALAAATESPELRRGGTSLPELPDEVLDRVSIALATSKRPLLITGLSFTRAAAGRRLLQFVERQQVPFVSTLHAKGFLPESHPNWAGVLGRARRTDVQAFIRQADLIIAVGFDPIEINYEEWVGDTPVVHLSTETAEVGAGVTMPVNAASSLESAIERLSSLPGTPHEWDRLGIDVHRRSLERALRPDCNRLGPHQVLDLLRARLPQDGILAYDVGAHTHQIATQWRTDQPRSCLATNGWSSMGYGMPAAYAAKLVHPDRAVAAVVGDGGFQMTVGELSMARRLNLAVPTIVLNDGWLGLMKVKQERKSYPLSGVYLGDPPPSPPHYFGVPCRPARDLDELDAALEWALDHDGPTVVEAFVNAEPYSETVFD